jgi:ABC-type Fe3+ transport system substrate-binding protein
MSFSIRSAVAIVLTAIMAAGIAPLPAMAEQPGWDAVVAAAKQEGKVVVYNATHGTPYYLAVVKSFEQTYGIKVETLDLRASELTERIRAEQAAGRYLGDLEQHGTAVIERQTRDGILQAHGDIPNVKNLREAFPATAITVPAWVQAYGVLVNTALVKPADEPKTWHDLLDPKWTGKILSDDTRAIGGGNTMFDVLYIKYGDDFVRRLAAQNLFFSRDQLADARRVARGEYPLYIPQLFAYASNLKGMSVKVVVPEDGSPYVLINSAILTNAPHPNAARAFMNHFIERESQLIYANAWMVPVVDGVIDRADPEARRLVSTKLMGETPPDRQEELLQFAVKVFAK